jgi:ATP/ADP translocase
MDQGALAILILVAVVIWVAFWRQRQVMRSYSTAQREILDRHKESMSMQAESLQLLRESNHLLGVIAKALEHRSN